MNKKIKNYIIYGIFILLLFLSTLAKSFSSEVFWPSAKNMPVPFDGILFNDPQDIQNLTVTRAIANENNRNYVKYDISFDYIGDFGDFRILGNPIGQTFFPEGISPVFSDVELKGDYDKINSSLFTENLKLKDLYKKVKNYNFMATSKIRVPLKKEVTQYNFTVKSEPKHLNYGKKGTISENSVFITNARVDSFKDTTKPKDGIKNESKNFNQSGYYVNSLEIINEKAVSSISTANTINSIVFVLSIICMLLLLWLNSKKSQIPYMILMMLSVITVHRFLDRGASVFGMLIIWTILAYIGAVISNIYGRDEITVMKKDLKRSLAWTIIFFVIVLIIFIIPRAI